jgi:hypothetical protein
MTREFTLNPEVIENGCHKILADQNLIFKKNWTFVLLRAEVTEATDATTYELHSPQEIIDMSVEVVSFIIVLRVLYF